MGSFEPAVAYAVYSEFDRLAAAKGEAELCDVFADMIARYGCEHFVIASSRIQKLNFGKMIMLQRWPRGWTEQYQRENMFAVDPVANYARATFDPFCWSEAAMRDTAPKSQRVMQISAHDYNLREGLCVPIHGTGGYQATVSVSGRRIDLTDVARRSLEMAGLFVFRMALKLRSRSKVYILSPREREVISWAAAGKSAWDTSEILSISEQTVKSHISSACAKLEVGSKTQAVVESIRLGEIRI